MRSRPWPLMIVAFILILSPLGNAMAHSFFLGVPLNNYFYYFIVRANAFEIFGSLILFPLAGLSLLTFKKWSYGLLGLALAWATIDTVRGAINTQNLNLIMVSASVILFDIFVLTYYLLPNVRTVYFNARVRWWETQPRFPTKIKASLRKDGKVQDCSIENISEGGVLVHGEFLLKSGAKALLVFEICGKEVEIPCEVLRSQKATSPTMGIQFEHNFDSKALVKKYVTELMEKGVHPRTPPESLKESFKNWIKTLVIERKGFTPDLPEEFKKTHSKQKAS